MPETPETPASPSAARIVVDRIEGDRAVLDLGSERVDLPLSALPTGLKEGDRLSITVEAAPALSAAEARLARLRARPRNLPTTP